MISGIITDHSLLLMPCCHNAEHFGVHSIRRKYRRWNKRDSEINKFNNLACLFICFRGPKLSSRRLSAMSKFEKRLCIVALIFVAIYLGAAVITIKYRISKPDRIERLESPEISAAEGQLLMAELFLPVMILLTLTICYIIVRKTRAKKALLLDEPDEETPD